MRSVHLPVVQKQFDCSEADGEGTQGEIDIVGSFTPRPRLLVQDFVGLNGDFRPMRILHLLCLLRSCLRIDFLNALE